MHEKQLFLGRNAIKKLFFVLFLEKSCIFTPILKDGYLWEVASPKIEYYWRDGTFDALEELRTRELYDRKVDTSISYSSRHM